MAISTFSALRTEVASWLNRTDLTTDQLKQFVSAAESDIRNDVECREGELTVSGSVSAGQISCPSNFLYVRSLTVGDHVLNFVPTTLFAQRIDEGYTSGYYTIAGSTIKVLGSGSYSLIYVGTLESLYDDSDTNFILANAPNVYLWAACKYGCVFLRDIEGATGFDAMYRAAAQRLNSMETRARFGGDMVVRAA